MVDNAQICDILGAKFHSIVFLSTLGQNECACLFPNLVNRRPQDSAVSPSHLVRNHHDLKGENCRICSPQNFWEMQGDVPNLGLHFQPFFLPERTNVLVSRIERYHREAREQRNDLAEQLLGQIRPLRGTNGNVRLLNRKCCQIWSQSGHCRSPWMFSTFSLPESVDSLAKMIGSHQTQEKKERVDLTELVVDIARQMRRNRGKWNFFVGLNSWNEPQLSLFSWETLTDRPRFPFQNQSMPYQRVQMIITPRQMNGWTTWLSKLSKLSDNCRETGVTNFVCMGPMKNIPLLCSHPCIGHQQELEIQIIFISHFWSNSGIVWNEKYSAIIFVSEVTYDLTLELEKTLLRYVDRWFKRVKEFDCQTTQHK